MPDKTLVMKEAQKYLAKGQIDKAIAEWEKLAGEAPDPATHNTIGDLYLRKGMSRPAVENFHRAAKFYRAEGFSLKALALYKKIINIDSSDADSLIALGELSEEKGIITDAIKFYLSAADILSRDTRKDRFLGIYEKILSLAPFNVPLREKVAGLFRKEGLLIEAAREYLYLARFCLDRGEADQAGGYFAKILDIQPSDTDALIGLSTVHEKTGDIPKALVCLKNAIATNPDALELYNRIAVLLKETGAHEEAISYLDHVLLLHPYNIDALRLKGEISLSQGDREKAWKSYREVVDAFANEEKFREAVSIAQEFKDLDPVGIGNLLVSLHKRNNDPDAAFAEIIAVADLLAEQGIEDEAMQHYREALAIRPDAQDLKKKLAEKEIGIDLTLSAEEEEKSTEDLLADADIFLKYSLFDEAKAVLEDLKVKEPANIDVHAKLKSLYIEMGDREQAVTECLILAGLHSRDGDTAEEQAALQEAVQIDPEDPRLLERMAERSAGPVPPPISEEVHGGTIEDYAEDLAEAEFYLRQGLSHDALRIYKRLLGIFPHNEDLGQKVAALEQGKAEAPAREEKTPVPSADEEEFEEFTLSDTETVEVSDQQTPQFDSDVLDIFQEFKKGLEKELDSEDYETHYNLGIAYREMGLIDDAIKEFQTSRKDRKYFVHSMSMLGVCYLEKGVYPLAIDAFKNALSGIGTRDESYWGARYDLALAYEKNGDVKEAYQLFSEVYGWNSTFREVADKINQLRASVGTPEPKQPAAGREGEKKSRVSYL